MDILLRIIIVSFFVLTAGCTMYGPFSGAGKTVYTTTDGTKITETTDMKTCTKIVHSHFKDGTEIIREYPMDPELCQKAKKEKE